MEEGTTTSNDVVVDVPSTIEKILPNGAMILSVTSFVAKYAPSMKIPDFETIPEGHRISKTLISPAHFSRLKAQPSLRKPLRDEPLFDLVDHVIWSLVQRRSRDKSQRNVLSQGYVQASAQGFCSCPTMRPGVVCTQINDSVSFCKTSTYCDSLHRILGGELMRMLLLYTSVFVPLEPDDGRNNYFLLCGPPFSGLFSLSTNKRKATACGPSPPRKKRRRGAKRRNKQPPKKAENNTPTATCNIEYVPRHSLFYSSSFLPKVGLPKTHILQRSDTTPRNLLDKIVGLHTPNKGGGKKRRKRWNRLRNDGIRLCEQILRRHGRCDYHRLLNRYCPLPSFCLKKKDGDEVGLEEVGSAHSPSDLVLPFLAAVIRRVFPIEFWGSEHNLARVLDGVRTYVTLRRDERLPLRVLTKGIRVTDVCWVWGRQRDQESKKKRSQSDHEASISLLTSSIRWFFCHFILPLLRSIFYVTETEFSAKRVLFYRKPVWSIFRAKSMNQLLKNQYTEITLDQAAERLKTQNMGLSRLKLLPKTTGVRPVAMLSKREYAGFEDTPNRIDFQTIKFESTNSKLANVFQVLRYEQKNTPGSFGAGLFGLNQFYPLFRSFLDEIRQVSPDKMPPLFFASVDIRRCFDNINQAHLANVVDDLISEDEYLIQRCSVTHPFVSMGRIATKPIPRVGPPDAYKRFHDTIVDLSERYTNSVFTENGGCCVVPKGKLLSLLNEHISSHLVVISGRYSSRFLLQSSGIPQGSVLSSLLCNMYLGDIEKKMLSAELLVVGDSERGATRQGILVRLIDDFLLITTNQDVATRFMQRMEGGKSHLGIQINKKKSLANFTRETGSVVNEALVSFQDRSFFPWCGLLIDTSSGEVLMDYTRFAGGKATSTITVDRLREGRQLEIRMKSFARPRCQPILYDGTINSPEIVFINFAQMMLLCAVKTAEYIRSTIDLVRNEAFVLKCIHDTICYAWKLIIRRLNARCTTPACSITKAGGMWLGRCAFHAVFRRLPSGFDRMARGLRAKDPGNARLERAANAAIQMFGIDKMAL